MSASTTVGDRSVEAKYRRLLCWYPRTRRDANEDALIGTLLDVAHSEGRERPRSAEAVDLAVNGLGARVASLLPAAARDQAASFAFGTGLAWSLLYFLVEDWMPWSPAAHRLASESLGPFNSPGVIVTALWVIAALSLWSGRVTAARISLLVAAVAAVAILAFDKPTPAPTVIFPNPDLPTFVLLIALALVAASGHPRRHWSVGFTTAGWVVILAAMLFVQHRLDRTPIPQTPWRWWWYDFFGRYLWFWPTNIAYLLIIALVAAAILALLGRRTLAGTLTLGLAPWAASTLAAIALGWPWMPGTSVALRITVMAATWAAACLAVVVVGLRSRTPERSRGTPDPA